MLSVLFYSSSLKSIIFCCYPPQLVLKIRHIYKLPFSHIGQEKVSLLWPTHSSRPNKASPSTYFYFFYLLYDKTSHVLLKYSKILVPYIFSSITYECSIHVTSQHTVEQSREGQRAWIQRLKSWGKSTSSKTLGSMVGKTMPLSTKMPTS